MHHSTLRPRLGGRTVRRIVLPWVCTLFIRIPLTLALGLIVLAGKHAGRWSRWVDNNIPAPPCPKRWSNEYKEQMRRAKALKAAQLIGQNGKVHARPTAEENSDAKQ
jgi:hypothetical protein